jgi:guanylate kinase
VTPTLSNATASEPGRLIVVSGASGAGKSTLVDRLLERPGLRLRRSISATTRAPRGEEVDGVDYYFLTPEAFEAARPGMLESAEVHGHRYGTPLAPVLESLAEGVGVVLVIDVQGALLVREKRPEALLIFVTVPSFELLEARLRARGTDDEATILRRLDNARREVALASRYDHVIVNDDLDRAVDELVGILTQNRRGG